MTVRSFLSSVYPFHASYNIFRCGIVTNSRSVLYVLSSFLVLRQKRVVVVISPSEKVLPAALNFEIIKTLQTVIAPNVFTPRGVYDGRKNMFSAAKYSFGDAGEVGSFHSSCFPNLSHSVALVFCLPRNSDGPASAINGR